MIQFDVILEHIGGIGKAQFIILAVIWFYNIAFGFNSLVTVFIADEPDYRCNVPPLDNSTVYPDLTESNILNYTTPYDSSRERYNGCYRYGYDLSNCQGNLSCVNTSYPEIPCDNGFYYNRSVFSETIVTEFNLVCNRKYLNALSTSLYYAGMMLGSLCFGFVSDKIGRKSCSIISYGLCLGCMFGVSFCPSIEWYIVLRFGVGAFCFGAEIGTYVYLMEIVQKEYRALLGILSGFMYTAGYMILSGLSYNWRNWHDLMFVSSLLSIPFLVLIFFLPESPRWLFAHDKEKQAIRVSRKIARINGRVLTEEALMEARKVGEEDEMKLQNRLKYNMTHLFRSRRMLIITINILFNWFVNSFVYYGVSLNAGALPGDIFVNNALNGVFDILAHIACLLLINRIGRKPLLTTSFFIAGSGLLASVIINEYAGNDQGLVPLGVVFAFLAKFGISASFSTIYTVTIELYPTLLRSNALGLASFSARIGGVVAPYVIVLQDYVSWLPNVIFGILGITAGLLSLLFPETKNHHLMETIEEAEDFYSKTTSQREVVCSEPKCKETNYDNQAFQGSATSL